MAFDSAPVAAAKDVTTSIKALVTTLGGDPEANEPTRTHDDALTWELRRMEGAVQTLAETIEAL